MKVTPFRSIALGWILSLLVFTLIGCGGGGGAGGSFVYRTDWTNRGTGVTGLSQRVRVFDLEGRLKSSLAMNQDVPGTQQISLAGIGAGNYRLFVELYSQRDLGGLKTGEVESRITVAGGTIFTTAVGESPTSVSVTPEAATFRVQQSHQFFATAYATPGRAAFVEVGAFTWQALGGVATVNSSGLALGTAQGSGSVRATHTASALFGGATITVEPFVTTNGKWTVLVYLNAANDLYSYSTLNMNQMEQVAGNSDVRFVVQWKQSQSTFPLSTFDGTRRYLVKPDTTSSIASELIQDMGSGVDMGSPTTLNEFVTWGKTYFPAQRYVLVVWNHGNGWLNRSPQDSLPTRGVSYDDETGNYIRTHQLGAALGSNVFDIVAWDASLMQMLEVAYEIKDQAQYVVGSEESPPGEGYPYQLIFDNFRDNPDATTLALSKAFVDGMLEVPSYAGRKITQSVIDTSRLSQLAGALDTLAGSLIGLGGTYSDTDLELALGGMTWSTNTVGSPPVPSYQNIGLAHDNNLGTSATNPAPSIGDELAGTFADTYLKRVVVTGDIPAGTVLQVQDSSNTWITIGSPGTGASSHVVGFGCRGVRLRHMAASASPCTVAEIRLMAESARLVRTTAQSYSPAPGRVFRDLRDLCTKLGVYETNSSVQSACLAVNVAIANAVVWEGHNSNSPRSNGVSIDFSPASSFNSSGYALDYSNLRLGQATRWDEWLGIAP